MGRIYCIANHFSGRVFFIPEPTIRIVLQAIGIVEDPYDVLVEYGVDRFLFQSF